jgi:4-hydroxythreonine-4-phosphate dehydrogenase
MGDPAGVGPEIVLRAAALADLREQLALSVVGSRHVMEGWAERLSLPRCEDVVDIPAEDVTVEPGHPSPAGAGLALRSIEAAARMCLSGDADAMVTAPVSKASIEEAGTPFIGHTEYLAELAGVPDVLMTFVHGRRRVALATTHMPLAAVPRVLSKELILRKLGILRAGLESSFGIESPRIAVTGLNPHAGEAGRFGDEEERVIAPAIAAARDAGADVKGPFPADVVYRLIDKPDPDFDAVLVMYHDQGTIAVKLWGISGGVNVTLGLPIVRTSVDHGTAFDLAGAGEADPDSMIAAIRLAGDIITSRAKTA